MKNILAKQFLNGHLFKPKNFKKKITPSVVNSIKTC